MKLKPRLVKHKIVSVYVYLSKIALLSSLKMSLYCDGIICFLLKKVSPMHSIPKTS